MISFHLNLYNGVISGVARRGYEGAIGPPFFKDQQGL